MASTYSTRLSIELPADGEQEGTWGQTLNRNMGTLIEEAIAGVVDISVTAGNVTLTTTQGETNEARQAVLNVTGAAGTPRQIIAPTVEKVYWVINGADDSITIKGAATTGVTITSGNSACVAYTGSDFVALYQTAAFNAGSVSAPGVTFSSDNDTGMYLIGANQLGFAANGVRYLSVDTSGVHVANLEVEYSVAYNVNSLGSVTSTATINCALANFVRATSVGDTTWSVSNVPTGAFVIRLEITNGGAYTQTWMAGTKWPGGTPPTLTSSGVDVLEFTTFDSGANWRGGVLQLNSA